MLKSSEITVQLNLPCSYSNTCIVNLFSGPLSKKTHTQCSTYILIYIQQDETLHSLFYLETV